MIVYSTTNEQEGLPLWKIFEDATGIKVLYVRASDAQILSRVIIEARAGQRTWDIAQTANVQKFPQDFLADFEPNSYIANPVALIFLRLSARLATFSGLICISFCFLAFYAQAD